MSKFRDKLEEIEWKKIGKQVGKFAPLLGSALGGPAGGLVGGLIAEALGVNNTPQEISEAIKTDPEAAVKLKALQVEQEDNLKKWAFSTLEIELLDKQNARAVHSISKMPAIICLVMTILVAVGAYLLFTIPVPEQNASTAYLLFGTVLAKWGDSVAYWVGTTRSSAEKDRRNLL